MYNLNEFAEKPDSALHEISADPGDPMAGNNGAPPVDFFNSAGNTKLSDDDEGGTDDKQDQGQPGSEKPKGKIVLGKVISGKSAVALINIFIPSFLVFAFTRFGYKTDKGKWKLTSEEREIMNPVVQDCLDYIVVNFDNPYYALAFVAIMIYGSKAFDIVPELQKIKEQATKDIVEEYDEEEDNDKPKPQARSEYIGVRKEIESTSIRKEKKRLTIQAIADGNPGNLVEAFKIYNGIFPERTEGYFREWYMSNYESLPDHIKFSTDDSAV